MSDRPVIVTESILAGGGRRILNTIDALAQYCTECCDMLVIEFDVDHPESPQRWTVRDADCDRYEVHGENIASTLGAWFLVYGEGHPEHPRTGL